MNEASVEQEIFEYLKNQTSLDQVVQNFTTKILNPQTSFGERQARIRFLYNAGFNKEIFELYREGFYNQLELPYSFLIGTFERVGQLPETPAIRQIYDLAQSQFQIEDLTALTSVDAVDPRFAKRRQEFFEDLYERAIQRKSDLVERLGFFRSERLVNEERKLLDELKRYYPNDPSIKQAEQNFAERWARHVVAQASTKPSEVHETFLLDADLWPIANVLFEEAVQITKIQPERIMDFTLMFWFLELYPQALIILEQGPMKLAAQWLKIEILLKLRRFVDVLDEIKVLELEHAANPETPFASVYSRAQALYGLGQPLQGLQAMQSILAVRPDYRSAASFVLKWSEGRGDS